MDVNGQFHALAALTPRESAIIIHRRGWLDGHQTRAGCFGEEESSLSLRAIEPRILGSPANILAIAPTTLSRFLSQKNGENPQNKSG
jgi:hypothetical protein